MVDPYAIVRRLTGHELISPKDAQLLTEAVDGLIDEIGSKDARIAELEAEVERLKDQLGDPEGTIAHADAIISQAKALASTGAVKVKVLEWEETHSRRSDEDPTTEWNGGFEADSALGYYEIRMGVGSDAYYWAVTNPLGDNVGSDFEDPSYAKAAAQADYERRILSAIEPAAPEGQQPVASGVNGVDWIPLTEKNDVMTCPMPSDETVIEVMLKDGTVCRARYSCNIMEAGDWDFVPVADDDEPGDDADSIASEVVAWRHPLQPSPKPTAYGVRDTEAARDALRELANVKMDLPLEDWCRISNTILSALEPAAPEGQQPVAWGVFYRGKIVAVSLHKGYHYTVPLYTRPSEQAATEAARAVCDNAKLVDIGKNGAFNYVVSPYLIEALKAAMEAGRHE